MRETVELIYKNIDLYFKLNRLKIAVTMALLLIIANLLLPLFQEEKYDLIESLKSAMYGLIVSIIVTPALMFLNGQYKKQQTKNNFHPFEISEAFTLDNFLKFFSIYIVISGIIVIALKVFLH